MSPNLRSFDSPLVSIPNETMLEPPLLSPAPLRLRRNKPHIGLALLLLTSGLLACSEEPPTASDGGRASDDAGTESEAACFVEAEHQGEATYYAADGTGNCSFEARADLMVAALNTSDYATAAACGGCVEVRGPDGSAVVEIVDRCPGCEVGDIDLSPEAFEKIAALTAGRVPVQWDFVACPSAEPLQIHFKDGSNEFWTAMQVRRHRYQVTRLEASSASRDWHDVERLNYNYFVDSDGLGAGPYDLRVHDINGSVVELLAVQPGDDVLVSTGEQLPLCD